MPRALFAVPSYVCGLAFTTGSLAPEVFALGARRLSAGAFPAPVRASFAIQRRLGRDAGACRARAGPRRRRDKVHFHRPPGV
ncbi:MAG: hypothetical protein GWN54_05690 [Gammaproteobacteria bacterium]|nr:hypothetical protein [Gammaproteobacteria bacterium]